MPRKQTIEDRLAQLYAEGKETAFQRELVASIVLESATATAKDACKRKMIPACDVSEVAQRGAVSVIQKIAQFDAAKSGIRTWTAVVTRSRLLDYLRESKAFQRRLGAIWNAEKERYEDQRDDD